MDHVRNILSSLKGRGAVFFGGYALYLVFSFMAFHSATLTSVSLAIGHDGNVVFSASAMAARIGVCALCVGVAWRLGTKGRLAAPRPFEWTLLVAAIAFLLGGMLVLAMVASLADAVEASKITVWLGVSGALLGCGDVLVTFLWARFSATLDLRQVYLYVTLCNGASLVLYFVATLLPGPVVLPLAAALFLASALAAQRSLVLRGEEDGGWTLDPTVARALFRDLWHPILGTTILCFMGGLMLQISGLQDISLGTFQQTSLWASAAAIACLLVPALVVRKLPNLTRVYSVALPVSAAGFLLLPLIWNAAGGIVNAFVQVGAMVAGIILWCMLADAAHRTRTSPILLFSVAFLATSAAQLAGTLVGWVNAETLRQGDLALTAIALVSVYLLLLAAIVLFRNRSGAPGAAMAEEGADLPVTPEEALCQRCAVLAERYGFTPRESDIFLLLAQGYTMPAISERLFVSENTVKSHVKRIYQKLGIHTRSELIDLVNEAGD